MPFIEIFVTFLYLMGARGRRRGPLGRLFLPNESVVAENESVDAPAAKGG